MFIVQVYKQTIFVIFTSQTS